MRTILNKVLIGASIAASVSAIASPASAASLTNASIGGTAANDYYVYGVKNGKTVQVQQPTQADVQKVLDGNAASPTGNVELRASSEKSNFDFTKNTTLTGQIGGKGITLSSLTKDDWYSKNSSGLTLVQRWFNAALTANGFGSLLNSGLDSLAFSKFVNNGGLQRFSDPNISYVNQDETSGEIKIGLAGHHDATSLLLGSLNNREKTLVNMFRDPKKVGTPIQASEIVKYTYNGVTDYLFGFSATQSGLVSNDGTNSHNGNYEVSFLGEKPASTPEPSVMLGMLGVAGVFAAQRKLKKA